MFLRLFVFTLFLAVMNVFAQNPTIEPGVPQTLAKWRAANYSDVRYKLNLTLEKMSPTLKGAIEISVKNNADRIVLDWRKIRGKEDLSKISNVSINGKAAVLSSDFSRLSSGNAKPTEVGTQNFYEINEHLVFKDGVIKGENVIRLDFTSPIATSGAAITRYVDKEDGAEYVYSLFVPSDASTAFPVFDQPDLKARFKLNITVPRNWKVVSNTSSLLTGSITKRRYDERREGSGDVIISSFDEFEFLETKPISTYVFAFAAGDFAEFEDKNNSTISRASGDEKVARRETSGTVSTKSRVEDAEENESWRIFNARNPSDLSRRFTSGYLPDAPSTHKTIDDYQSSAKSDSQNLSSKIYVRKSQAEKFKVHAKEVFRLNREGVKFLESYFDYKFPFPKYDLVLIPEFPFGGMEHAGATFLREDRVIFPTEPTKNDYITRANVIFHEAAHQWFGDTVTMKWFDDLWLKEGFAEFMAYKTLAKVMPEYNAWKIFYERNKQLAYLTDSTKGTTPIYQEIPNLSAAKSAYGNIVYRKAPSFLRQAEFYLGEDKFQIAVRAFLKKHEFANAEWTDLVKEFETASKQDLKDWANVWVKQRGLLKIIHSGEIGNCINVIDFEQNNLLGDNAIWKFRAKALILYEDRKTKEKKQKVVEYELGKERVRILDANSCYGEFAIMPNPSLIPNSPNPSSSKLNAIFPNYQDYGYGIFTLNYNSRAYVLENIQTEKDDFLRAMMWGSLWDSVRETELAPKDYVELVIKNINVETDESTIQTLLGRVSTAMNYYLSDAQSKELAPQLETILIGKMQNAPTLGQRITFYRAFLNIASSEKARTILKDVLSGKSQIEDLKLKTKDRFDIITKLLILGDKDAPNRLAEMEKIETTDEAKRYGYAARAGIGTAENKAKFWNDFVSNKELSESYIESAFVSFNSPRHSELTLQYLEKALAELPNLKRSRKIFFVNGWLAAFIGGQRSEQALAIVNKFLADNPNLDKDLRLKVLENADGLERAVRIRAKYGNY